MINSFGEPYQIQHIGTGDGSIHATVAQMKRIIDESSRNPEVRLWAQEALANIEPNQKWQEAEAIFNFVRDNVRYTRDPRKFEYVQTPPFLLKGIAMYRQGKASRPIADCDDMATLGLSLLASVGFETAVKVTSYDPFRKRFQHVYGMVNVDGQWTPFDCVRPNSYLGWEAPRITRHFVERV